LAHYARRRPPKPLKVAALNLILGRQSLSGSLIGGIAETRKMLVSFVHFWIEITSNISRDAVFAA
jgi:D-arabinose 1-dehydrogenase-like Zn-dependent alcohol dehydrogenase